MDFIEFLEAHRMPSMPHANRRAADLWLLRVTYSLIQLGLLETSAKLQKQIEICITLCGVLG